MSGRLAGKVAIITGAASGQGRAEAVLFAAEGASVVATDLPGSDLATLPDVLAGGAGAHLTAGHDVRDESSWLDVVSATLARFGRVDVLVNNAGVYSANDIEATAVDEWDRILDVNARGVFLGMKAVIPHMRSAGSGSIINISSTAGVVGEDGAAYTSSKGAVRVLTKHAAISHAASGIRVNSVHPGTIVTPMIAGLLADPHTRAELEKATPLPPHFGQPDDVAPGVVYLASDESRFVTGSELVIDGGYLAR
jgi:NAD(P)-dependent dehydrogenase (short-subunit alcohol dehydrogenase family)